MRSCLTRIIRIKTLLILVISLYSLNPLFSEVIADKFKTRQKKFIGKLFIEKRYFDCISESRRLINYIPEIHNKEEYIYFIEANYFLGGQFKTVISHIPDNKKSNLLLPYQLLLSRSLLELGMYRESLLSLYQINYTDCKDKREELFLRREELLFRGSAYQEALNEIYKYRKFISDKKYGRNIENDIKEYRTGLKSKGLSVFLSAAIPGTGQIYSGRYLDGLISLTAILASLYGAYYYQRQGERAISYTLAFFSVLFYSGSIYGAYNSADSANRLYKYNFRKTMERKYIPEYSPINYIDTNRIFH